MDGRCGSMEFCCFLRSVTFVARFLGRFLERHVCVWLQRSRAAFFEKLAHFLAFVEVGVFTTEVPQSKKLREWNGVFYVLWMRGRM